MITLISGFVGGVEPGDNGTLLGETFHVLGLPFQKTQRNEQRKIDILQVEALKEVARHLKKYIDDNIPEDIETRAVVVEGNPAELILKQAQTDKIDLIVIASHNSQIANLLLGSCAAKVVRHSSCTVTVVK